MAEVQSSILIVDDDAEDLAFVEKTLRSLGSELHSVKDPHEVLPSVYRHRPDVVILDALLPGLSGFELCQQIKSDAQLKGTQVLILTGVYLRQQYRQEALKQFKADAFLTKPFRPPELQRSVVQLLARKTRLPQSTFLKRIGLPATGESRKRGLFGRLFGRGESGHDVETVRIAPLPRDRETTPAPTPAAGPKIQKAEGVPARAAVTNLEANTVAIEKPPPAPMPRPDGSPVEGAPMAAEHRLEPPPTPHPWLEPAIALPEALPPETEPAPDPTVETAPREAGAAEGEPRAEEGAKEETTGGAGPEPREVAPGHDSNPEDETTPPLETAPDESELSAGAELEAPPAPEGEGVIWVEADTRTQDMTLDEIAARIEEAEAGSSETEAEPTPSSEAQANPPGETPAPAEPGSSVGVRRPRLRAGDVPIYDESDFLRELKRELSKCKRVDRPLTLILIRVGDLSQIVELFGKDFRDPVLWHIAEQAMDSLREVDLVGMMSSKDLIAMTAFASDRYGGGRIVSRLRQAVSKNPFRVGDELPPIIPALDFGMATFPADGGEVSGLMRRAEKDLSEGRVFAGSD